MINYNYQLFIKVQDYNFKESKDLIGHWISVTKTQFDTTIKDLIKQGAKLEIEKEEKYTWYILNNCTIGSIKPL